MSKKKLEIIDLELGIDVSDLTATPPISPETQEQIDLKIRLAKQETDAIKRVKAKREKQQNQKDSIIEQCFKTLLEANDKDEKVPLEEIQKISGDMKLSSVVLMINNLIKKRGNLWCLIKSTKNKKKYYHLVPR
jgi:molecular chaperone DnaK (HSP70)